MIFLEMNGRLGNQLFRYAAARAIQLEFYPTEKIILNFSKVHGNFKKDPTFIDAILDLNIKEKTIYKKEGNSLFQESSLKQKVVALPYFVKIKKISQFDIFSTLNLEMKHSKRLMLNGIYWFRYGYQKPIKSNCKNKFLTGNFESSAFFSKFRNNLLEEFSSTHALSTKNYALFQKIKSSQSVCISVRRGDFVQNNNISPFFNVCTRDYFYSAIKIIKTKIPNPIFFFFSDDIEWVKSNLQINNECYFESGKDPVYEKLTLMKCCKHFIISNSTFSWWAQYLSTNHSKIVISPKQWFHGVNNYNLVEDYFIKL